MADMRPWLNYHHLQYFAAIVEEGGLVPAAKRLGVSHPTVSEQVKKLESALSLKLFERLGRRLQLTQDGELVYGYATQIFGVGSALLDAVEGRRAGQGVLARIGVDSGLAKLLVRQVLLPLLGEFEEAPQLRCVENTHERLMARLRAHELDVVLSDSPADPVLGEPATSHLLAASGAAFFATPALRAELGGSFPECLDGAPLLVPLAGTRFRRELERWLLEQGLRVRIAGEVEDSGLLKALGQSGCGVFVMPAVLQREICRQYGVVRVGTTDDVEARVFAIATATPEANATVRALFQSHGL